MTIEKELQEFVIANRPSLGRPPLDERPSEPHANTHDSEISRIAHRNSELILDHFGMGSLFWPTLQQLADAYDGLGSRERARQIIQQYYTQHEEFFPLSTCVAVHEVLISRDFWIESEFIEELNSSGLTQGVKSAKPLLDYLKTQGLAQEFEVYMPDLMQASRQNYFNHEERVVVNTHHRERLKKLYKRARKVVGLNGLSRLEHIASDENVDHLETLKVIIQIHKDAWCTASGGAFWYAFDDRDNTLVNSAEKVFSVIDQCNLEHLSDLLANSLRSRTSPFNEYPDQNLVREWIAHSGHFRLVGNLVSLNGETADLNEIEKDVISIMRGRGAIASSVVNRALKQRGHGDAYIQKQIFSSALVFVDRSGGRGNYRFTCVSDLVPIAFETFDADYDRMKMKLDELDELDIPVMARRRQEQYLLRKWLFGEEQYANCAICGNEYGIGALVTAHKKKRSRCKSAEKKDPYIVFPLCVFGCDYLYEHGYVSVVHGVIVRGRQLEGKTENKNIDRLIGRPLEERWLRGSRSYFDNLPIMIGEGTY